jgi:hypothetical protein
MGHRWDCPTDYEAEREGGRAAERGRSIYSNPYSDHGFQPCHEAEENWERGFRREQRAIEDRQEEERMEARRAEQRREEARWEEYWSQQQYEEQEYPEPPTEEAPSA